MPDYANILSILHTMSAVICIGGASLLFLRGKNSRSRRLLSAIMSAWGIVYVLRVVGMLMGYQDLNFTRIAVVDTLVLVVGNLYLIFLLLYPIEIVRPGWLNLKRICLIMLPYVSITLFYYVCLYLLGQRPVPLCNIAQFAENIREFNVWYRLFMSFSIILYLGYLFRLTWKYEEFYRQWCRNNYSNDKDMDISWLRQYGIGVLLIGFAYFGVLFNGSTFWFIVHNLTVQCFFCYTLYNGLFHYNPYTENFFSQTMGEEDACRKAERNEKLSFVSDVCLPADESAFIKRLPSYCEEISGWMIRKKPYLNPDFKLMDVADVLPMNRTYLSRVFNEGFGSSFSDVVRDYRIREAEKMLTDRKDIPVGQVGELCGFSSPSVFNRAFALSHDGLTPNRYRRLMEK